MSRKSSQPASATKGDLIEQAGHGYEMKLVPIAQLTLLPKAAEIFPPDPDVESRFAADIHAHRPLHPIEVTPAFVVIGDHRQLAVLNKLGHTEVRVLIRYDLAALDEKAVFAHLVNEKLNDPHLTRFERVRAIVALAESEGGASFDRLPPHHRERVKKRLAADLGMSPRSIDRWMRVLTLPAELQRAFGAGKITLGEANRIASLPWKRQVAIAEQIAGGTPAKDTIAGAQEAHARAGGVSPPSAFKAIMRCAIINLSPLEECPEVVTENLLRRYREPLQRLVKNMVHLKARLGRTSQRKKSSVSAIAQMSPPAAPISDTMTEMDLGAAAAGDPQCTAAATHGDPPKPRHSRVGVEQVRVVPFPKNGIAVSHPTEE